MDIESKDKITDGKLRDFIKESYSDIHVSPWFTRKVLNRLPERKYRLAGKIELITCFIGIVVTSVLGVSFVFDTLKSDIITIKDFIAYSIYLAILTVLIINIATPFIYRRSNKISSKHEIIGD